MLSEKLTALLLEQAYISRSLNNKMNTFLSLHGLSFDEFILLYKLSNSENGELKCITLADSMGMAASNVVRMLAPLEKNNIILKTSNPEDARKSIVSLSSIGQELVEDALVGVEDGCQSMYALFDDADISQLSALLNKIKR